jgi:hypothetical protein
MTDLLPLAGLTVRRVSLDYAFSLLLAAGTDPGFTCTIECPFTLRGPDLPEMSFEPNGDPTALAPALLVRHLDVLEAGVAESGELRLSFACGLVLRAPPHAAFDAWNVSGPDGFLVVCTPGGELAVWAPEPPTSTADLEELLGSYAVSLRMDDGIDREVERRLHSRLAALRAELGATSTIPRPTATLLLDGLVSSWATTTRYSGPDLIAVEQSLATLGEAMMAVLTPDQMPPLH